ncbi:hypothetical protein [Halomicrobium katesii]|uniref:hypothetical protein n=1 Tax=Halomicrobium katesii TaxID=437163 RepID=UPI0012BAB791|nr:hypothetical protein [Halomicrobium katesii]
MHRRQFVSVGAGLGLSALVAGCPGLSGGDGAALVVRNGDDRAHTYEVEVDGSQSTAGDLSADESSTIEGLVPYEDYTHAVDLRVIVDDETARVATIRMQSDVQQVYVEIVGPESVEIGPDRLHSPTPSN